MMYKLNHSVSFKDLFKLHVVSCEAEESTEKKKKKEYEINLHSFVDVTARMCKQSTVNSVPLSKQFVFIKNYSSMHRNNPESLRRYT